MLMLQGKVLLSYLPFPQKIRGGGALDRITAEKTSSKYKKDDGNNRADSSSDLFSIILYKSPRVMIQMSGFGHM